LKLKELEKQLDDQKKLAEEMRRKAEQGSMQLQGEVAELELEKVLRSTYPSDEVSEIPKGVNGADILLSVRTENHQPAGIIAIESKRTKSFSQGWIDKLKADQRSHKADIAIIVTEVMPKDMTQFGMRNGIWICTFQDFIPLVFVLRDSLIRIHGIKSTGVNKSDKMSLLYSYLTSQEFTQQIQTIVEAFTKLKANLESEKKAMFKIWKEREKTIDAVTQTTAEMYGSIKSIAGNSVKSISALEMPMLDDTLSENHI